MTNATKMLYRACVLYHLYFNCLPSLVVSQGYIMGEVSLYRMCFIADHLVQFFAKNDICHHFRLCYNVHKHFMDAVLYYRQNGNDGLIISGKRGSVLSWKTLYMNSDTDKFAETSC